MKPILYVIVRNDLKFSLNAGKAMAQVSHASAQFVNRIVDKILAKQSNEYDGSIKAYTNWVNEGQGFGTTIVLEATKTQIETLFKNFNITDLRDNIIDSTYPLFIPQELLEYNKQIKKNLNIVDIGETNEKGLTFVTMKQHTCSWMFLYDETNIENFKEQCKNLNIGLAR